MCDKPSSAKTTVTMAGEASVGSTAEKPGTPTEKPKNMTSTRLSRAAQRSSSRDSTVKSRDPSTTCTSPTKDLTRKLPPIKAPVGLAKGPDLKNVRSKIGSLQNVKHRPVQGERKVITQKLEWQAKPRIGSLDYVKHKPAGGDVKIENKKLDWKAQSKIGSLENVKHKPGGGQVNIFDEKYTSRSSSVGGGRSPSENRSISPSSGCNTPNGGVGSSLPSSAATGKGTEGKENKLNSGKSDKSPSINQKPVAEGKALGNAVQKETKSDGDPKPSSAKSTDGNNNVIPENANTRPNSLTSITSQSVKE